MNEHPQQFDYVTGPGGLLHAFPKRDSDRVTRKRDEIPLVMKDGPEKEFDTQGRLRKATYRDDYGNVSVVVTYDKHGRPSESYPGFAKYLESLV